MSATGFGYRRWHATDLRWDLTTNPNEPRLFGWVVEIDPFDSKSMPANEGCRVSLGRSGPPNGPPVGHPGPTERRQVSLGRQWPTKWAASGPPWASRGAPGLAGPPLEVPAGKKVAQLGSNMAPRRAGDEPPMPGKVGPTSGGLAGQLGANWSSVTQERAYLKASRGLALAARRQLCPSREVHVFRTRMSWPTSIHIRH
nr:hypothetical protein [Roseateles asaccharophilus]